ncbi:S-protein homolog 3-like [Amaranthus tricolor]|uniref:S-protein homolog 3-like n=1 Tax=Amaranthus tricolor TaxID=29722 RepID=UPI0025873BC1|nr:S-protein homolog 3-like [Amaranthus tricolor]
MGGGKCYILITLLLILISLKQQKIEASKSYNVTIVDGLGDGENLVFRCQSKDTDFGVHYLNETGQSFSWVFKVNIIRTTLYFCHFYWKDKDVSFPVFEAHNQGDACGYLVYWQVRDDGFYFHCDADALVYKRSWYK